MNAENGNSSKFLGSKEKQLGEIKQRLLKAINIFISIHGNNEKLIELTDLVNCAQCSADISFLVQKGLDCTK